MLKIRILRWACSSAAVNIQRSASTRVSAFGIINAGAFCVTLCTVTEDIDFQSSGATSNLERLHFGQEIAGKDTFNYSFHSILVFVNDY